MKVHHKSEDPHEFEVRLPAATWDQAAEALLHARENEPVGYSLAFAGIAPYNARKGGRRARLKLVLRKNDSPHPRMGTAEIRETFVVEEQLCS